MSIKNWWVTRPKRKLNSIPELLAQFVSVAANNEWSGNRDLHIAFENAIESTNLKRIGERRDASGSGGRTYIAWMKSLGLLFAQNSTNKMYLTLAGEAIISGENIQKVLSHQVIRYQFPSLFSCNVRVDPRFRIHPFWFLLKLLSDSRLEYLTEEEISHIIIVQAENESDKCYESVVKEILSFRNDTNLAISSLFRSYYEEFNITSYSQKSQYLDDIGNTIINWLDYTQLIVREPVKIRLSSEKVNYVNEIIKSHLPFIPNPENEEVFQRKYGLCPWQTKDTRNLTKTPTITPKVIRDNKIRFAFFSESLKRPITRIDARLIETISEKTGYTEREVEDSLHKNYAKQMAGILTTFLANYRDMAFASREKATEFELATVEIFKDVFGMKAFHVGPKGKTPDVLVLSDEEGYSGIIDNKAYSQYSITNDHHNRMVKNYIGEFGRYSDGAPSPAFFSYIAGGFVSKIDTELQSITQETSVPGSAMKVDNMINLIQNYDTSRYTHSSLRNLFSLGREISLTDIQSLSGNKKLTLKTSPTIPYNQSEEQSSIAAEP